ncbi:uncharacterized protein SCHCODRAFT_02504980 [Schizophyllum commune H4-8]|nr:uncharacterized protein SCHCODRAFT_02504980 [Schizophyllum commune H4-8]KAI5891792.1 hypothetical protein SCHCODRAFT_02504980 [Schizophyllum commune H4-8]
MCARIPRATLTVFTLTEEMGGMQDDISDEDVDRLDIRSLLGFCNLVELRVNVVSPPDLTDAEFRSLAQAWPRLRVLSVLSRRRWDSRGRTPSATLLTFVSFAELCPHLKRIEIVVDARLPKRFSGKPGRGAACHALRQLHVGASPIDNATLVAAFLSDIFPPLGCVEMETKPLVGGKLVEETRQRRWSEVKKLLPTFNAIRLAERTYVAANEWQMGMRHLEVLGSAPEDGDSSSEGSSEGDTSDSSIAESDSDW